MDYERINSAQNARVKNAIRLRRRRGRERQNRILVDGTREIQRAAEGGVQIEEIYVSESTLEDLLGIGFPAPADAPIVVLSDPLIARICYGDRAHGPVALAIPPQTRLDQLSVSSGSRVAVLDGVEKPGNVGAVIRSADAAGMDAVVISDGATDLYNPNAIRASLGTVFTLPVCVATAGEVLTWLGAMSLQVVVARLDGELSYDEIDYRLGTAIVLGSEAKGVSPAWQSDMFQGVRLPMCGAADSVNVSAAAAVLFYEANRQRRVPG